MYTHIFTWIKSLDFHFNNIISVKETKIAKSFVVKFWPTNESQTWCTCILIRPSKAKTRIVKKNWQKLRVWNRHFYTQRRRKIPTLIISGEFIDWYDYVWGSTSRRNSVKSINYVIIRLFRIINKYDISFCVFSYKHNPFDISAFWAYSSGVLTQT